MYTGPEVVGSILEMPPLLRKHLLGMLSKVTSWLRNARDSEVGPNQHTHAILAQKNKAMWGWPKNLQNLARENRVPYQTDTFEYQTETFKY